jgi:energy-coupling factor transport system substrate-specific component
MKWKFACFKQIFTRRRIVGMILWVVNICVLYGGWRFGWSWSLVSFVFVCSALLSFFNRYERDTQATKELAVIAALAAFATVSRIALAAVPQVKPTTFLVILSGLVFGPQSGFMVGSLSALSSNVYFGQGPWTPWQMFAWGMAGWVSGWLGKAWPRIGIWPLAIYSACWGFLYDWLLDIWSWLSYSTEYSLSTFLVMIASGIWFDILHAFGNVLFAIIFGVSFRQVLVRFKRKLSITYLPMDPKLE